MLFNSSKVEKEHKNYWKTFQALDELESIMRVIFSFGCFCITSELSRADRAMLFLEIDK